jgi:hypothetical protein
VKRALPVPEFVNHPFLDRRLRVIDSFIPKEKVTCPVCFSEEVGRLLVVESEYPGGVQYYVVECRACEGQNWFVLQR